MYAKADDVRTLIARHRLFSVIFSLFVLAGSTYLQGFCESQGENPPVKTDESSNIISHGFNSPILNLFSYPQRGCKKLAFFLQPLPVF